MFHKLLSLTLFVNCIKAYDLGDPFNFVGEWAPGGFDSGGIVNNGCYDESWNDRFVKGNNGYYYVTRRSGFRMLVQTGTAPGIDETLTYFESNSKTTGNEHGFSVSVGFEASIGSIWAVSGELVSTNTWYEETTNEFSYEISYAVQDDNLPRKCKVGILTGSIVVDSYKCKEENDFVGVCPSKIACTYSGTRQIDGKYYQPTYSSECKKY